MQKLFLFFFLLASTTYAQQKEKTAFQTGSPWRPEIDIHSDIAIVYGAGDHKNMTFEQRVKSWRDHGYLVQFMTGIAWGSYDDYFLGKWDGKNHLGIGQVTRAGDTIWHGHNIPYVVPESSFIEYMKKGVIKKVIDNNITAIYLEEPEFWARAGYSEVFKQEWQKYYGFPWRPQHESPEATYLSSKLKYHLYYNAIKEVSAYAKSYGKSKGLDVKVYIPTHSLVNYSSWQIVSPEASLASLSSIDGYIAQVWTGTSREPTFYNGQRKERVFENAFLEYGSMISMTAPTKRKVFLLTDPIEDWPRDWSDYKRNYQATFTAKLLYPTVADYEVMPWPERIYTHPYKVANSDSSVLIPKFYSTQMQVMVNALNDMPVSTNKVTGVNGIGVLMGNSLMFQRYPTHNGFEDPQFSNFYGQTLPLVKLGIPVQTVHMENLSFEGTLKDIKVLIMSYANMKPQSADVHQYIAAWVKKGGVLIYCGADNDPYQSVMEWWNTKGNHYKTPAEHLFSLLKNTGKGKLFVIKEDPKDFVMKTAGADKLLAVVKEAYPGTLTFRNHLYLERGPYDIVAVMDETTSQTPYVVNGPVIDLFDPTLPVLSQKTIQPGEQALLYNINRVKDKIQPQVLATAARIYDQEATATSYSFTAKSPINTINAMRVLLPSAPSSTTADGLKIETTWDVASHTLFITFNNKPDGVRVNISY